MCGIFGVMDKRRPDDGWFRHPQAPSPWMNERGSGEGGGYAAYGIYPDYRDCYALHVFFDKRSRRQSGCRRNAGTVGDGRAQ